MKRSTLNIGLLLEVCGITYTIEQLEKLEKLIEDISDFKCSRENEVEDHEFEPQQKIKIEEDDDEDLQSKKCNKTFKTEKAFTKHIKEDTCDSSIENLCQHCGKVFASPDQLRTHLRYNHKERPEECHICHHKFHSLRDLKRHISGVHEGRKEVQCQLCGKFFSCSNTLSTHVRCVHLKIKSFSCQQCPKSFTLADTLKKHMIWAHSKERPYVCVQCQKAFAIKNQLSNHIKVVHEKIKRFQCSICHLKFGQKATLDKHVARIHEKQKHVCQHCNKVFTWNGALKTHLRKVHDLVP